MFDLVHEEAEPVELREVLVADEVVLPANVDCFLLTAALEEVLLVLAREVVIDAGGAVREFEPGRW